MSLYCTFINVDFDMEALLNIPNAYLVYIMCTKNFVVPSFGEMQHKELPSAKAKHGCFLGESDKYFT